MKQNTNKNPKIYLGVCKKSVKGNTNLNSYWVQSPDGLYRSNTSDIILCQEQVNADVKQGYLKEIKHN